MLAILSPSKTLDFDSSRELADKSTPCLFNETLGLIEILKGKDKEEIKNLMKLSDKLAELNYERYQNFANKMTGTNSRQAIFAFKGDVYDGLDADSLNDPQIKAANDNIAILSGLYGLIRPLDLIQPYRLEMGTKLDNPKGKDLYKFWGDKISKRINELEDDLVINLASNEYFKAVNKNALNAKVVDINFKEDKDGKVKVIGIYAKKARGMMARYIVENKVKDLDEIKKFNSSGYKFSPEESDDEQLTFIRKHN